MKTLIFILTLFLSSITFSQTKSAEDILEQIKDKMSLVNDYYANVEVSVKMDFLKMPNSKAELYFKKPDKFKFNSTNFAILPKAGFEFNPQKILSNNYQTIELGDTIIDNEKLKIFQITPDVDSLKFKSANLLVNVEELLIKEIILDVGSSASIITKFTYGEYSDFALPSELKVTLNFSAEEKNDNSSRRRHRIPSNFKGDILIKYKNYKVNEGIEDSFFVDEEKEEITENNTDK